MKLSSVDALAACERHETLRGEGEPFAVFGSREQQFIGIDSPDKYDQYMRGVDSQSDFGVSDSSSRTERPKSKIQKEEAKACNNPQTPCSIFTFAALWDPDTGFTAYEKGKLLSPHNTRDFAGHRPFNPSVNTAVSHLPTTHLCLPRVSKSQMHERPIPSSTLERLVDPWFFDPLSLPAEFREPNSSVEFQVRFDQEEAYLSDCIDHESLGDHPDCEPHLPSRFSTTTTSTSNYIDVDFRASNPPFRGPLMTPNDSTALPRAKSQSFKREKSMSRLSRAIKGRWSRRAHDEHWVFVEVQSVITDWILEEQDVVGD